MNSLADPRGGHGPPRRVGKHPECTKSRHFQTKSHIGQIPCIYVCMYVCVTTPPKPLNRFV